MIILFPSDYFDKKKADEMLIEQYEAFQMAGFSTATISLEDLTTRPINFYPELTKNQVVLYRGWMLSEAQYKHLTQAITQANATLFTKLESYLLAHHIPNWYPLLSDLTAETVCFTNLDNLEQNLRALGWEAFFVKDFVKSLKTSVGSYIQSAEQINTVIQEMQKFKGYIEGGICVRKLEDLDTDSEQRYFVIQGVTYGATDDPIPNIVLEAASRIKSDFFSIDLATCKDGTKRIVEIGDGQVSDIVGWSTKKFVSLWSNPS